MYLMSLWSLLEYLVLFQHVLFLFIVLNFELLFFVCSERVVHRLVPMDKILKPVLIEHVTPFMYYIMLHSRSIYSLEVVLSLSTCTLVWTTTLRLHLGKSGIPFMYYCSLRITRKKILNLNQSNHCGEKLPSLVKYDATFPKWSLILQFKQVRK